MESDSTTPINISATETNNQPLKKAKITTDEKNCAEFLENGWNLIQGVTLNKPIKNALLKRGNNLMTLIDYLFLYIPISIWKILENTTNRNLSKGQSVTSPKRWSNKPTSIEELIRFY